MTTITIISVEGSIFVKSPEFIQKKTVLDILKEIPQINDDDCLLAIKTPTYMKILHSNSIPYDLYPNIINENSFELYSIPDFYLQILNISSKGKLFFIFNPSSPQNPEIVFPPFIYGFVPSDYSNKPVSNFISDLVIRFGISISNPKIFFQNHEIPPDQDFKIFFKNVSSYVKKCLYESPQEKMKSIDFQFNIEPKGMKKIKYRETGLKEILDTEESYCSVLRSLNDYFSPLFKEHKIMSEEDHQALFGPIPQMIETSVNFSNEMSKFQNYSSCVAPVFLSTLFKFKQSSLDYFVNYNLKISEVITELDTDPQVQKICDESPNNPGISFQSVVIQPIQRFPRYPLLLRELLKNTPQSHPDFYLLHQVNRQVESMVHELADAHLVVELSELKERLVESSDENSLFNDDRVLMKSFSVHLRDKLKTIFSLFDSVKCSLYLFNDMLLLTSGNDKEIEQMRCDYDKFVFIPNYPDNLTLSFYFNNEFRIIEFSSVKDIQIFKTLFVDCRKKIFDSDKEKKLIPPIKAMEYFQTENQIIYPMLDSSCCKLGNSIYCISHRNYNIYTTDNHSFTTNDSIKGIHKHSKLAIVNDKKFLFGGSKNIGPFEIIDDKVVDAKPKYDSNSIKLELIEKIGATKTSISKEGRIYHTCCSYKNYIVVFGGINPKNPKKVIYDMHFYSIETGDWYENTPTVKPEPRYKHSAVIYKDTMIIHGGINPVNDQIMKDTWSFNFLNGTWSLLNLQEKDETNNVPRFGHAAVMINHFMFVIGGLTVEHSHIDISHQNESSNNSIIRFFSHLIKDTDHNDDPSDISHCSNNSHNNQHKNTDTSHNIHHQHHKSEINQDQNDDLSLYDLSNINRNKHHHFKNDEIKSQPQFFSKNTDDNSHHHHHHHSNEKDDNSHKDTDTEGNQSEHHHHHHINNNMNNENHHYNSKSFEEETTQNKENNENNDNDSLSSHNFDTKNVTNNEKLTVNDLIDESSDNFEFEDEIVSESYLTKNCVPAPNCFCINTVKGTVENVEIVGNFISGISMFSAAYDESNEQIIIFGGRDPNKHFEKGIPKITFLDIPQHYVKINRQARHSESDLYSLSSKQKEKGNLLRTNKNDLKIKNVLNNHKINSNNHRPHSVSTMKESTHNYNENQMIFDDEQHEKNPRFKNHHNHNINDEENYINKRIQNSLHDRINNSELQHNEQKEINHQKETSIQEHSSLHHNIHHRKQILQSSDDDNDDENFIIKTKRVKHKSDTNHIKKDFALHRMNPVKENHKPISKKHYARNNSVNSNKNRKVQSQKINNNIKSRRRSSSLQNYDINMVSEKRSNSYSSNGEDSNKLKTDKPE